MNETHLESSTPVSAWLKEYFRLASIVILVTQTFHKHITIVTIFLLKCLALDGSRPRLNKSNHERLHT